MSKEVKKENATLLSRSDISEGLFIIRVKPDFPIPDFIPGQYVALGLLTEENKLIKRAYSIASSPDQKDRLEFYIARVDGGALTPRLDKLQSGDRLYVSPKITGTFTLQGVPAGSHVVFISTGTGIAPYISMLRTANVWQHNWKFILIHGVRYEQDLAYKDELEKLAKESDLFHYYCTVSRASEAWQGERGYVGKFLKDGVVQVTPESNHLFLCGNPAMIDELSVFLTQRGFKEHKKRSPGNLHLEKYW